MKKVKNDSGQALVEFALVLPLLLLILMAIIEFGLIFNSYIIISNASREGARLASLGGSDIEIVERVNLVSSALDTSKITVVITPDEISRRTDDTVSVIVGYDYDMVSPIISNVLSQFINFDSETIMRIE